MSPSIKHDLFSLTCSPMYSTEDLPLNLMEFWIPMADLMHELSGSPMKIGFLLRKCALRCLLNAVNEYYSNEPGQDTSERFQGEMQKVVQQIKHRWIAT